MVEHAREIANVGDEWFLSVASGLGRAGGWARKEADIVADSAVAAFATTMTVAKKLMSLATVGLEPADAPRLREAGTPAEQEEPPPFEREVTLDLVSAIRPDDGDDSDAVDATSTDEWLGIRHDRLAVRSSAGVVPLLQALGRTVANHAQAGYASLQEDRRFWSLVHLVQTLGRPSIAPEDSHDAPETRRDR